VKGSTLPKLLLESLQRSQLDVTRRNYDKLLTGGEVIQEAHAGGYERSTLTMTCRRKAIVSEV
jgi:hypothetical protein